MITDAKKNEFLARLFAHLPNEVSPAVVHAIVQHVHSKLGVAFSKYMSYAEASGTGMRTVERTIAALHRHGVVRKQPRQHHLPPLLWFPELMDMEADEALQRANEQNFGTAENGYIEDGALSSPYERADR
jgi:hypothetical protein